MTAPGFLYAIEGKDGGTWRPAPGSAPFRYPDDPIMFAAWSGRTQWGEDDVSEHPAPAGSAPSPLAHAHEGDVA